MDLTKQKCEACTIDAPLVDEKRFPELLKILMVGKLFMEILIYSLKPIHLIAMMTLSSFPWTLRN